MLTILAASLITAACVTGYHPTYRFNQLQVVNLSSATIEDVSVRVFDSEKSIRCAEVRKNAICNERFGVRNYPQQGIELSWTHTDGSRKSETFNPPVPITFYNMLGLRIVMEVNEDGSVNPFYEQDEPDGMIFDT